MSRETPSYAAGALTIDPVGPDDLPIFRELLGELVDFLDMRDVYTVTDDDLRHALFDEPPQVEALLARYNGEAAGLATWTEVFHPVVGKFVMSLEFFYVRPQFRSHLITPALLIYLIFLAKHRGYFRIEWFVHEWNAAAIEFYKSLKAEEIAQKPYRLSLSEFDWSSLDGLVGGPLGGGGAPAEPQA